MTMQVTVVKTDDDSYQARVIAVDHYQDTTTKVLLAVLKRAGEELRTYCTSTRRIEIVEETLEG